MSLWTPGGEVPVNRRADEASPGQEAPPSAAGSAPGARAGRPAISEDMLAEAAAAAGVDLETLSPEERAQLEAMLVDMAEAQARLAEAPAAEIIVNHLGGIYELARIHLSQVPPRFEDASLAIDTMAAVLDAVEPRLGPNGPPLRDAVRQLELVFVQLRDRAAGADPAD